MARQGRGQVITQAHPLIVIVLEREDALIGTIDVRQKLAQGIGIFEGGGFQRIEAIALVNRPNSREHLLLGHDLGRPQ